MPLERVEEVKEFNQTLPFQVGLVKEGFHRGIHLAPYIPTRAGSKNQKMSDSRS